MKTLLLLGMVLLSVRCGVDEQKLSTPSPPPTPSASPSIRSQDAAVATPSPSPQASPQCLALHSEELAHDNVDQCDVEHTHPIASPTPTPTTSVQPSISPTPTPQMTPPPGPLVIFNVPAGTGSKPWNTKETMLVVKIGQTLRIVNKDSATIQLHTPGAPCAHGAAVAPGKSFDCKISKVFDPGNANPLYNHLVGQSAAFWVKAIP